MIELHAQTAVHFAHRKRDGGGVALAFPIGAHGSEFAIACSEAEGDPDDAVLMHHLIGQDVQTTIVAGADPAKIATALSRVVGVHFEHEQRALPHLSLFCGIVDRASGEMRYVNRDHAGALVVDSAGLVRAIPPTTVHDLGEDAGERTERVTLEPADVLVFSTAAITRLDVREALPALVAENRIAPEDIIAWARDREPDLEDATVLVVRVTDAGS